MTHSDLPRPGDRSGTYANYFCGNAGDGAIGRHIMKHDGVCTDPGIRPNLYAAE
jgi:hypothetical protein